MTRFKNIPPPIKPGDRVQSLHIDTFFCTVVSVRFSTYEQRWMFVDEDGYTFFASAFVKV